MLPRYSVYLWLGMALAFLFVLGSAVAQGPVAKHAARTIQDITQLLDQYKPDPQRLAQLRATVNEAPPASDDPAVLVRFYHARARAAEALGQARQRLDDLEKALPYAQRAKLAATSLGGNERRIVEDLAEAWGIFDYRKSIEYSERSLAYPHSSAGYFISDTIRIANIYITLGDFTAAEKLITRAEARLKQARDEKTWDIYGMEWRSFVETTKAYYKRTRGKLAEAEQLYRSEITLLDQALVAREERVRRDWGSRTEAQIRGQRDGAMRSLAITLQRLGRFEEAEVLMRDVLIGTLGRVGSGSLEVGNHLRVLAEILADQGRAQEALQLAGRAVQIFEEFGTPKVNFSSIFTRQSYAARLVSVGRYAESVQAYEALRRDVSDDARLAARFAKGNGTWAYALLRTGRSGEAIDMLRGVIADQEHALGPAHINTGFARGYLGMALAEAGKRLEALREMRAALDILVGAEAGQLAFIRRSIAATKRLAQIASAYVKLLSDIRGTELERDAGINAVAEAFRMSDIVRGQAVQQAVAASAARGATDSPLLAALVRQEQDLTQEAEALYRILLEQISAPPEQQLLQVIATMRMRTDAITKERQALIQEIERRFPAYANFINPKPPAVEQMRAVLREGEVLLSVLTTAQGTFVWAIPKTGAMAFHATATSTKQIAEKVAKLRAALDVSKAPMHGISAFDVAVAHELYALLLQPVAPALAGAKTLYVAASGSLGQLPFAVLVEQAPGVHTESSARSDSYVGVPWLARTFAIAQLPSANSLLTLRAAQSATSAGRSFTGFGDPQFAATVGPNVAAEAEAPTTRNLSITRVDEQALADNTPIAWLPYSHLPALPDTGEEILALAAVLKADPGRDVFLGPAASKEAVKKAFLSESRIVAFATHGLLPGDFPGLNQPALALAAPAGHNVDADPLQALLTLEDVLSLKLNAEWVVLSACNTAAGDGAGAEAITGLGRAFFYAGSRALLVTHWPVETVSARKLVTDIFARYATNPSLSRAEALRQAMLALMQDEQRDATTGKLTFPYAHPMFWAPYALVGDGGR